MARRKKFNFNPDKVLKGLDKATKKALVKFGAYVRRSAKSSLKLGRMVRMGEMDVEERKKYKSRRAIAKYYGRKPPKRRRISAEPGNAPKLKYKNSPLRKLLFFGFDSTTKSVVVGPLAFRGLGASNLEHGRRGYRSFPTMEPALRKNQDQLPALWRNAIRK